MIKDVHIDSINISVDRYRFSRIAPLDELVDSIKKNGIIDIPVLLENNGESIIVSGHRRIEAAKAAGLSSITAEIWNHFNSSKYYIEIIKKIYNKKCSVIGRLRGFSNIIDSADSINIIDLRKKLLLPEYTDQPFIKKIFSLPDCIIDYLDEKDTSLKIIEKLISFDSDFLSLCNIWLSGQFRYSIFRSVVELYEDIIRSEKLKKLFNQTIHELEQSTDEQVLILLNKIRYPEVKEYLKKTNAIISEYKKHGVKLEMPVFGEGSHAVFSITLKRSDSGKSFKKTLDYLANEEYMHIIDLL